MGLEQWSRGEYTSANNREDDTAIITRLVGTRPNLPGAPAACTTTWGYRDLSSVASSTVTTYLETTLTCPGGSHSFPMRLRGRYSLRVTPPTDGNIKFQVSIVRARLRSGQWVADGRFTTLGVNDAYSSAPFTYTSPRALSLGNYIIRIQSIAERGNSATYPFPGKKPQHTLQLVATHPYESTCRYQPTALEFQTPHTVYGSVGRYQLGVQNNL